MIQRDLPTNAGELAWHTERRCKSAARQRRDQHCVQAIVHFVGRDDDRRARFAHLRTLGRISRVSQTSNLFIGAATRPCEACRAPLVGRLSKTLQLLEVPIQLRLWDSSKRLRPTLTRLLRSWADNQSAVPNRNGDFGAKTACFQQLLRQQHAEPIADLLDFRLHRDKLPNQASRCKAL